ncbi:response regulator [Paenibacillus macerans]|uniref:Response regulator n=1 Tax=Paenibacillus macerans TaxID=44252 RepID=A0A090ZC54_PAEMA|nr:response regulator [Paenibacillus macerans]KFN08202.1 response regulator [Paenibacillus macerans]MCY7557142.1 response regulator [Paenibacillus macerans]MEC0152465.1 response regulator [Paenibacillus macerans]SUA83571.1 winged helix family two component transcriptional regulator [Paenibacillus macerans]
MNKLLLLEDDLSLIDGLSYSLNKQGFHLDIARTIREAEVLFADGTYDLLILDVSLPDGSGFEVCRKVRQVSKVPIVFLRWDDAHFYQPRY